MLQSQIIYIANMSSNVVREINNFASFELTVLYTCTFAYPLNLMSRSNLVEKLAVHV